MRELVQVIQEYLEKDGVVKVKGLGTFKLIWNEPRKKGIAEAADVALREGGVVFAVGHRADASYRLVHRTQTKNLIVFVLGGGCHAEQQHHR